MVAQSNTEFLLIYLPISLGIFIGDLALYFLGKISRKGISILKRYENEIRKLEKIEILNSLKRNYVKTIFLSRFLPGTRLPIYLLCGFLEMSFLVFIVTTFVAVSMWTGMIIYISSIFQKQILNYFQGNYILIVLFTSFVFMFFLLRFIRILFSKKERIEFSTSIQKAIKPEFWPSFIFYLPLLPYIILLSIRYRGVRYITTVNPAIEASGIAGESKAGILDLLPQSYIAKYIFIESSKIYTKQMIIKQIKSKQLSFPLILKPDKGERGFAVQKVHSVAEIIEKINKIRINWILQEFIPGSEIGLFYIKYPNENNGKIFSITIKTFPEIMGDGKSNLKTLICNHNRYKYQKETHLKNNISKLYSVPKAGDVVKIGEIGNHVLGCMFEDGKEIITPKLSEKINKIMAKTKGVYFGRFDIRYSNLSNLKKGKNFKIIELNGATSESTNLYDPRFKIWEMYSILFHQWTELYKIGYTNFKSGAKLYPYKKLIQLIYKHFTYKKSITLQEGSIQSSD